MRAVVDQSALGMIEQGIHHASVRLAQNIGRSLPVEISRQIPSGSHELPSEALAEHGLSGFRVNRRDDSNAVRTVDKVFHLELTVLHDTEVMQQVPMGARAYVTLRHADEPLGQRWLRISRRLLMKHLNV